MTDTHDQATNELTPQERLLADATRDAAILRHIATSADDLNTPDDDAVAGHLRAAARTTERLAALVRDAQPLPDADTVMERMTRTPQWTLGIRDRTLIRAALAAVAAIRQETQ